MNARFALGFLSAALAAAPCATAQEAKSPPVASPAPAAAAMEMPKPAAEMAQLKVFEGTFACEGTMQPSPFGPGGTARSTMTAGTALGGFWQEGRVKSTMTGMPPLEGMFHTTYDPAAKRYMMLWVDNMGAWAQASAPGWEGDKLVFVGDSYMGGQKMGSRDTFTRMPDGGFRHMGEMQVGGQWTQMFEEVCRKAAAATKK